MSAPSQNTRITFGRFSFTSPIKPPAAGLMITKGISSVKYTQSCAGGQIVVQFTYFPAKPNVLASLEGPAWDKTFLQTTARMDKQNGTKTQISIRHTWFAGLPAEGIRESRIKSGKFSDVRILKFHDVAGEYNLSLAAFSDTRTMPEMESRTARDYWSRMLNGLRRLS